MRWLLSVMLVCGSLSLMGQDGCGNSTDGEGGSSGEPGGGGEPGTGGTAGMGGTAGTGGSAGGSCGAEEPCTVGVDNCYDFCRSLCSLPEIGFCGNDGACICVCTEGECDRTDCTLVECVFGEGGDESCAQQGASLCGTAPRDAVCLDANGGTCDIVCASGVVTCAPEFM
jgi:hypothetical protein